MTKIKVSLRGSTHSVGRGVGYYYSNLERALVELPEIEITDIKPDIVHYTFFDLFYPTLPFIKKLPTLVSIHDLTPLALPDLYPMGVKGTLNYLHQRLSVNNVAGVITDSQYSKEDIHKFFNIDKSKIFVTPLAVDEIFSRPLSEKKLMEIQKKYNLPKKFILNVPGGPNPNKNLPALAEVTKKLGLPLVIVGKGMIQEIKEPVHAELRDLVKLKKYDHLIYPGFVPTDELVGFYQLATVYCQPSLYEGFGLPLLEAMTAGSLVVSSNATSLPEIYHPTAIVFDPWDLNSMEASLSKALSLSAKEREDQIKAGIKRSKDFKWSETAKLTLDVYKQLL